MTEPRLFRLECPKCQEKIWKIDSDYRGLDIGEELGISERDYSCPKCSFSGAGWQVLEKSPPGFLFGAANEPMSRSELKHWKAILTINFPDYSRLEASDPETVSAWLRGLLGKK